MQQPRRLSAVNRRWRDFADDGAMTGKFVCEAGDDGDWRFELLACNGQVILSSRGYRGRRACLRGIESVRRNSVEASRFEELPATDGGFRFVLKGAHGDVIGTGRRYASRAACRRGVASVQRHVAEAKLAEAGTRWSGAG